MNKKFISIFLAFLLVIFLVYAATYYRVNNGTTATITEHGVCSKVTNNAGLDIFVPTATAAEWSAFRTYKPAGVTVGGCCSTYTLVEGKANIWYWYYGYFNYLGYYYESSITPTTYNGAQIYALYSIDTLYGLSFGLVGNYPKNYFTSIQPYAGAPLYYTASATHGYSDGITSWSWGGAITYDGVGTSIVTIC